MYRPGEIIIERGQPVRELVVVGRGNAHLYGYFKDIRGVEKKALLVSLPKCSWFGDFQLLLKLDSTFQLIAGEPDTENKGAKDGCQDLIQTYSIDGETLIELLQEQPSFHRFVLLRSVRRRAHFLGILDDIINYTELERKVKLADVSAGELLEQDSDDAFGLTHKDKEENKVHQVDPEMAAIKAKALARDPFALHNEEQLQDELFKNVQQKIIRQFRSLKKLSMYKGKDPYSLRSAV